MARLVAVDDIPKGTRLVAVDDTPVDPAATQPTGLRERIGAVQPLNAAEQIAQYFPNWMAGTKGNAIGGFLKGAASPTVGAVQLAANAIGQGDDINRFIADQERQYQQLRAVEGRTGADIAEGIGVAVSPVNLLAAAKLPAAAMGSLKAMAGTGAVLGGMGGALTPVTNDQQSFAGQKAAQTATGAAVGAIATPLIGAVANAVTRRFGEFLNNPRQIEYWRTLGPDGQAQEVEKQVTAALIAAKVDPKQVGSDVRQAMTKEVMDAIASGKTVSDPAALARAADFKSLGMPYTLGQVTRDPMQFANEKNLSTIQGVGNELNALFASQNEMVGNKLGAYANNAADRYAAGTQLTGALKKIDDAMASHVSSLYKAARDSSGKTLDVPTTGLVQEYARVLNDFGDKVPSGVINNFNQYGFGGVKQTKIFDIDSAEKLLQVINSNRSNDPATNTALGQLSKAIKNAILEADDKGGVFKVARDAAAKRFSLHEALPALESASRGELSADKFVSQNIISADTDTVKTLASVLKADQGALGQARAQIGEYLRNAAFGINTAGDRAFSQDAFAKALKQLGTEKLTAFLSKGEVDQLFALSRVMSNMSAMPAHAPVNTSKTSGATASLVLKALDAISGGRASAASNLVSTVKNAASRPAAAQAAVNPDLVVPRAPEVSPQRMRTLAQLLGFGAAGLGGVVQK